MRKPALRRANANDAPAICAIYNHYVTNTVITFEEDAVSAKEMQRRIESLPHSLPWIVYEDQERILGYAYATEWKSRAAYKHSVETTVYLSLDAKQRGIGTLLYQDLIDRLRTCDCNCIIGGIALPNAASVALHEKLGFEKVAHFKSVGWKMQRWIDVAYWQLLLNTGV